MGRRSNRKNAQDLPATCVVVPNFELEPSEGEDWEGYPEVRFRHLWIFQVICGVNVIFAYLF